MVTPFPPPKPLRQYSRRRANLEGRLPHLLRLASSLGQRPLRRRQESNNQRVQDDDVDSIAKRTSIRKKKTTRQYIGSKEMNSFITSYHKDESFGRAWK